MSFSHIGNVLNKQIKQKDGLSHQIQASLVCEEFDKILQEKWGEAAKNQAKALYLKDKVLTVATLTSAMAQEIKLHEREILEKLNKKFDQAIDRVRFLI